jgi:hypothetical protein
MADLQDFNFKHPWALIAAAGAVIAAGSAASFVPGLLMGLGLLFFGVGEWINHPQHTEIIRGETVGSYITHKTNPWKPKPFGLLLDALGIGLFGYGLFLVAFAR